MLYNICYLFYCTTCKYFIPSRQQKAIIRKVVLQITSRQMQGICFIFNVIGDHAQIYTHSVIRSVFCNHTVCCIVTVKLLVEQCLFFEVHFKASLKLLKQATEPILLLKNDFKVKCGFFRCSKNMMTLQEKMMRKEKRSCKRSNSKVFCEVIITWNSWLQYPKYPIYCRNHQCHLLKTGVTSLC